MRYCEDCRYYKESEYQTDPVKKATHARCLAVQMTPDINSEVYISRLIFAEASYCATQRAHHGKCGPEGKLFVERES